MVETKSKQLVAVPHDKALAPIEASIRFVARTYVVGGKRVESVVAEDVTFHEDRIVCKKIRSAGKIVDTAADVAFVCRMAGVYDYGLIRARSEGVWKPKMKQAMMVVCTPGAVWSLL